MRDRSGYNVPFIQGTVCRVTMKLTRLTIREYAESLVIAFIMALIIRHYVVELFRIPTSSMEPTLIGNEVQGDRILVSKFQYDLHPPRRWDVIVFKIDENRVAYHRPGTARRPEGVIANANGTIRYAAGPAYVNYVKRLVGLPGETVRVLSGDLFINNRICRKPDHVQNALLVPVTNDRILERAARSRATGLRGVGFFEHWSRTPADAVTLNDGTLRDYYTTHRLVGHALAEMLTVTHTARLMTMRAAASGFLLRHAVASSWVLKMGLSMRTVRSTT